MLIIGWDHPPLCWYWYSQNHWWPITLHVICGQCILKASPAYNKVKDGNNIPEIIHVGPIIQEYSIAVYLITDKDNK